MAAVAKLCQVCLCPESECICCPECGHSCPREIGEAYCPVCLPDE